MDIFGCCSKYDECKTECLHNGDPDYSGCQYLKNVKRGNAFLYKGAVTGDVSVSESIDGAYLFCYDRYFSIYERKNKYSNELGIDGIKKLETIFNDLVIPFKKKASADKCIIDGTPEAPSNSRVIFAISETCPPDTKPIEYHIQNFNGYLINAKIAGEICKALKKKGFNARVETFGYSNNSAVEQKPVEQEQEEINIVTQEPDPNPVPEKVKEKEIPLPTSKANKYSIYRAGYGLLVGEYTERKDAESIVKELNNQIFKRKMKSERGKLSDERIYQQVDVKMYEIVAV